jgi:hypothetical protein
MIAATSAGCPIGPIGPIPLLRAHVRSAAFWANRRLLPLIEIQFYNGLWGKGTFSEQETYVSPQWVDRANGANRAKPRSATGHAAVSSSRLGERGASG